MGEGKPRRSKETAVRTVTRDTLAWVTAPVCQAHDKKIIFYLPTPVIPLYFQENGIPPEKGYSPAFSDISRIPCAFSTACLWVILPFVVKISLLVIFR